MDGTAELNRQVEELEAVLAQIAAAQPNESDRRPSFVELIVRTALHQRRAELQDRQPCGPKYGCTPQEPPDARRKGC